MAPFEFNPSRSIRARKASAGVLQPIKSQLDSMPSRDRPPAKTRDGFTTSIA
jgi:hypothetical protein